jgi:hypothetical protein
MILLYMNRILPNKKNHIIVLDEQNISIIFFCSTDFYYKNIFLYNYHDFLIHISKKVKNYKTHLRIKNLYKYNYGTI